MSEIVVMHGDSRELCKSIPDGTIDLVFTDPPYPAEYIELFQWLGNESARVLKPGGYLLTYSGQFYLDVVMHYLSQSLNYFWTIASLQLSSTAMVQNRGVICKWKPILIFSNGKPEKHLVFNDAGTSKRSKIYHEWGQSEETASYYIGLFTVIGDTVLDPFCGGGTTPYACSQIDRNCIAFDLDTDAVKVSIDRIKMVQKHLIPSLELQSQLWIPLDEEFKYES